MKRKCKFEDYKNCLKAAQFKNEINYEKEEMKRNEIDVDIFDIDSFS